MLNEAEKTGKENIAMGLRKDFLKNDKRVFFLVCLVSCFVLFLYAM